MSYDLYYWKSAEGEPSRVCSQLAVEYVGGVEPSPDVGRFRAQVLRRWPQLVDSIAPWAPDLGWRHPWGRPDLAAYFVSLTLPLNTDERVYQELQALAHQHGLVSFDPQHWPSEVDDEDEDISVVAEGKLPGPTDREERMDRESFAALLQRLGFDSESG